MLNIYQGKSHAQPGGPGRRTANAKLGALPGHRDMGGPAVGPRKLAAL